MIEQILQADRLLQVDQVDQARDLYARVVELDPGNAIAMVGLAQCALADGDDQRARELAAEALEIDPENDMARRMEARLSEILATRGDAVAQTIAVAPGATTTAALTSQPSPDPPGEAPTTAAATTDPPVTTPPVTTTPARRKSLFDRLMGR